MLNLLFLFLITVLSYLIGIKILSLLKLSFSNLSERVLLSIVFGLGVIALIMFILGILGLYYKLIIIPLFLISLLILMILFGKKEYLFLKNNAHFPDIRNQGIMWVIYTIFILYLCYNLMRCMTPVIEGDSLHAYLHVPNLYIENYRIFSIDWSLHDNLPLNIYMLNALGILLHSDILSQLISGWLMGLLFSLAVYVLARNFVSRKIALISAIIYYTLPILSRHIFSTKIDLGYTMFELCFWILFVKWIKSKDRKHLLISAIFLGFAIGSKYHSLIALFFAACVVFVLLLINKKKLSYILLTVTIFSIIALAIGSPSYIKNYIYTNDPVYPFISNPNFGSHENINQYQGIVDYIRFQYNMFFGKDYLLAPRPFGYRPIGFLPILFLPFIFFEKRMKKYKKKTLIVFGLYYLFLSFIIYKSVFPYPRHFLPAIGLLIVINSVNLETAFQKINKNLIMVVIIISAFFTIMFYNNVYNRKLPLKLRYIVGKIDKTEYLQKALFDTSGWHMNFEMLEYVKTMPQDTRIMTLDYGNCYYVERPFVKKLYTFTIRDLDSLLTEFGKDKITHIYFNKPIMEEFVRDWCNGQYSAILKGMDNNKLTFENKAGEQYLYRINY